jgi:MFS family permease
MADRNTDTVMKKTLAPVAALLIGISILLTGQGLQGTLLPIRASLEEFATISIGIMGAMYFLGFTAGCLRGGELVRRVGHIRVFAAMTALASSIPLLHGLFLNPWIWGLFRMITGFCFAVLYVVIESWLNEQSSNETRGTIFSIYTVITLTVMACGQMLLLVESPAEFYLFAVASVLVSLAAIPVVLSISPSPLQPHTVRPDISKIYRISPAGTLGCLATGLANGSFWSLAPVFAASVANDYSLAAWFMTAAVVGGAIAQWPLGYLSDKFGRRELQTLSALTAASVGAAIVLLSDNASFLAVALLGAAWGAFAFPLYAISVAHTNDHADPSEYVMVSSGLLLMYGIGAILGPFIASTLMTWTGPAGLFFFATTIHLLLVTYTILRSFKRESTPADQHIAFSDALASAQTASQVYEEEIQSSHDEEDPVLPETSAS